MTECHRILVVGVGSIGERHVRCMLNTGRVQLGICETNTPLRERIAQEYTITDSFCSLDEAMKEPWDAAVVATPAPSHVPLALQLAQAGISLLIEKPLAVDTDGVDALIDLVDKRDLTVAIAYVYRAHPALASMREAIISGRFGSPVHVAVVAGQDFAYYRPGYKDTYYVDRSRGGGVIHDAVTHLFNACEWIVGPMDRIVVDAEHKVIPGSTVEDTINAIARHGDVMACYAMNQYQAPNEISITVVCERGTARFELHNHNWSWLDRPGQPWNVQPASIGDRDEWFTRQESMFLDYLCGKGEPLCTLREGRDTLLANLAAIESSEDQGRWTTVRERIAL
jgi:predicted dehydrogenase